MRIHYNNGQKDKIIDNVLSIQVIDGNQPVTVLMATGKELTISLRNIETILDETIFEKPKPRTNFDRITESEESLAENLVVSINMDLGGLRHRAGDGKLCATWEEAVKRTIEWLQQEVEQ